MIRGFYYLVQSGDLFCFTFVLKDAASSLPLDLGLPFPRGAPQSPALQPLQADGRFRAQSGNAV